MSSNFRPGDEQAYLTFRGDEISPKTSQQVMVR